MGTAVAACALASGGRYGGMPAEPVPVSFRFSSPEHGWITMTVTAGDTFVAVQCSNAYDPFPGLARWATEAIHGYNGAVEIDEEGASTVLWIDRDPGSYLCRLRAFEPGVRGQVARAYLDATVDAAQLAHSFEAGFSDLLGRHDPLQWRIGGPELPGDPALASVDLRGLRSALWALRLRALPGAVGPGIAEVRAAYEAELGRAARPVAF